MNNIIDLNYSKNRIYKYCMISKPICGLVSRLHHKSNCSFPYFIMYCHKVGTCLPWHSWAYVLLLFPRSKITYTMVQVNIRPTPFKLVLKLYLSCLNMADERQILGLSNALNHNLENALSLQKKRRQFISSHSLATANIYMLRHNKD